MWNSALSHLLATVSHMRAQVQVWAAVLPIQLVAKISQKALGDLQRLAGDGPALVVAARWERNQRMKDCFFLFAFQIHQFFFNQK